MVPLNRSLYSRRLSIAFMVGASIAVVVAWYKPASAEESPRYIYTEVHVLGEMPGDGVLTARNFGKTEVHRTERQFGWHRGPGRGGINMGGDFTVDPDRVLVGWSAEIQSEHRLKGDDRDWKLVYENQRGLLVPIGIHTGARLNPDKGSFDPRSLKSFTTLHTTPSRWSKDDIDKLLRNGGASYHGKLNLFFVTRDVWIRKWAAQRGLSQ